jgi:recombination protein RecA
LTTLTQSLAKLQKEFGFSIGAQGAKLQELPRIPTGVFELDLAMGGGFPVGRMSMVYGTESSGKTTLAYLTMASVQRMGKEAVFVDVEGTFDPVWATHCGVDVSKVYLFAPATAEQASDIVESTLYADDVGIVVLDSFAALMTQNEIESESTKQIPGGSSLIATKLVKKATVAINANRKQEIHPIFLGINQIRHKIGMMYGDPETIPGGNALKFHCSLVVRLFGKKKVDKDLHPTLPAYATVTATIKKNKVPITALACEYTLSLMAYGGMGICQSDSWKLVQTLLRQESLLVKGPKAWEFRGTEYQTLGEIRNLYYSDVSERKAIQQMVIDTVKVSSAIHTEHDEPVNG